MNNLKVVCFIFIAAIVMLTSAETYAMSKSESNDGVVKIVSGGRTGTYLRLTDEMKGELPKHSSENLRVLPIIGLGSQKNLNDLLYLSGIDIALMQSDVMESAKSKYNNLDGRVRYITKLHDEEVHILARNNIKSIYDLAGKTVSIGEASSGTAMTASLIFKTLNIKPKFVNLSASEALKNLSKKRDGVDAFVYVSGKPVELFSNINRSNKFHFIEIPSKPLAHIYKATSLTSRDYKNLVSDDVKTVAAQAVMAVYNFKQEKTARYAYVRRFVEALFKSKEQLSLPQNKFHKKWQTIDLCEQVPGWKRHASVNDIFKAHCSGANSLANNNSALPKELIKVLLTLPEGEQDTIMSLNISEQKAYLKIKAKMAR
mgnify:CR=1 FL=1